MTKPTKWHVCPAKTQISKGIRSPNEETLVPQLPTEHTAKTNQTRRIGSLPRNSVRDRLTDQVDMNIIVLTGS